MNGSQVCGAHKRGQVGRTPPSPLPPPSSSRQTERETEVDASTSSHSSSFSSSSFQKNRLWWCSGETFLPSVRVSDAEKDPTQFSEEEEQEEQEGQEETSTISVGNTKGVASIHKLEKYFERQVQGQETQAPFMDLEGEREKRRKKNQTSGTERTGRSGNTIKRKRQRQRTE